MSSSVRTAILKAADLLLARESLPMSKPGGATRVLFATDLHGSTRCFQQMLRLASTGPVDVLIVGGDITGKRIVPIVRQDSREEYWVPLYKGRELFFTNMHEVNAFETQLSDEGIYGFVCNQRTFDEFSSESVN